MSQLKGAVCLLVTALGLWCPHALGADLYVCDAPAEGNAAAPTVVRPGEACPTGLSHGTALAIDFKLTAPTPLVLQVDYASSSDLFNLPDDLEVYINEGAVPSVILDGVPYGQRDDAGFSLAIPAEGLRQGQNSLELSMRRVDFPGVSVKIKSLRLSTGPGDSLAQQRLADARRRMTQQAQDAVSTLEALDAALTSAPYRVAVEHSLHKLFQDELLLVRQECQAAAGGLPWSLRRSRLVGDFLPSLLRTGERWTPGRGAESMPPALVLEAARNERESAQIVIVPCTRDLSQVKVSSTDIVGPEGAVISSENVDLRIVGYVETKPPRYDQERIGWWPDVLLPNFPVDCRMGEVQPVWITVYVPRATPPGDYEGKVRVAPAGQQAVDVPLRVHVWGFQLPDEPFLQTAVDLSSLWVLRFYHQHPEANANGRGDEEIYRNFLRSHLDHRMSTFMPGEGFIKKVTGESGDEKTDWGAYDRLMEFAFEHGQTRFSATTVFRDQLTEVEAQKKQIGLMAHLVQKGWFDRAYFYPIDEHHGDIPLIYSMAKRMLPGVRNLTTTTHNEALEPVIDIFVPRTVNDWPAYVERDTPRKLKALGKEYWVYTSGFPYPPVWPQVYVDCPAVDQRIIPWTCARWGMRGYEKVPITSWYHMEDVRMDYRQVRTPWDVNPGVYGNSNGEILMTYCGPDAQMMPSIRQEILRDAIDDYDYFMILGDYAGRLAGLSGGASRELEEATAALDLSDMIPLPYQFPRRPYVEQLLQRRRELARAIESAKKILQVSEDPAPTVPPTWRRGSVWCAATQPNINNLSPALVEFTLVNQSSEDLAGTLAAFGPHGWKLNPDRWEGFELGKGELRRLEMQVLLDEGQNVAEGEQKITFSLGAAGRAETFEATLRGTTKQTRD